MTSTRQTIEAHAYAFFLTPFERWHNLPYVGGLGGS
jgi:hypothetical protein